MNRRKLMFATATAFLASCGRKAEQEPVTPPPVSPNPPVSGDVLAPPDELRFAYSIEIRSAQGEPVVVQPDFRFHVGDRFRFRWRLFAPLHLFLFHRAPDSTAYQCIFPSSSHSESAFVGASSEPVPIPKDPADWFRLGGSSGAEQFVIVASTVPLPGFADGSRPVETGELDRRLFQIAHEYSPRTLAYNLDGNWKQFTVKASARGVVVVERLLLSHFDSK